MGRERAQRVLRPEHRRRHEYEVRFVHRVAYQQCQDTALRFWPTNSSSQTTRSTILAMTDSIYAASNLAITKNNIHDNLDIGDGNHEDAMQGVIGVLAPGAAVNHFQNILIDSNLVVRQTDPELSFPTYLQGIDAFDSDWTNVTVTNNVVITSACWGIAFSSIHNSLIANNTVVEDGLVATPGCAATIAVGDKTHEGAQAATPSCGTISRASSASTISTAALSPITTSSC